MNGMKIDKYGLIKYGPEKVRIRRQIGWFRYEDFLVDPGGANYEMIPVINLKKSTKLKLLWLKYAPEWYKKWIRHRSQMKFLDRQSYPKNAKIREQFGTQAYIEAEKIRIMRLPAPSAEFTGYDPKRPSKTVREVIMAAVAESKIQDKVKGE